jgi:hypothetical protein
MMNDKDKYSAHLEYLKVAITISTALLAVAAAIFSDSSKMPVDASRYALLTSAGFVFVTLVSSIFAIVYLCNFLVRSDEQDTTGANKITRASGVSFFSIVLAGAFVLVFFFARTLGGATAAVPASQAVDTVSNVLKTQMSNQQESLILTELRRESGSYILSYSIVPGSTKIQASVSASSGQVEWIKRQP